MLISTRGRYALRVLADMAEHRTERYIPLKDLAERQDISEKYLERIVKELVKNGVVIGVRGKGGGYRLARAPEQINVGEVLRCMEESLAPVACLEDGRSACPRMAGCRTLPMWQGLNEAIRAYLDQYTLEDLTRYEGDGFDYVI